MLLCAAMTSERMLNFKDVTLRHHDLAELLVSVKQFSKPGVS